MQDVISLIIEREEYLEKLAKVEYALSKITEKQRKAVLAYFFGEGKKKDIAESLGISPENFSYLKTAGINSIRRVLGIKIDEDKKQNS
jgi:DNA-directed RNA polymerase specialized sigma subunit